ncbi:hybrid sensor histidine kinase/response regulator [Halorubrum lipolyticum]|uniref:histidine kinase n=1 Tax=Halorubrum lipolyticum DSM 21995 TaxID=1227482 RepID=M0NZ66_9EURY|nr:PAS domain S-box protein [Halorubrum lipolyticum]EMA62868.1 multi-sensor signal transduction histidine kinase [Halorubrum lipolyticum DSM 21995]
MGDRIRVLHVDDDPDLAEVTASFLEREDPRIAVDTASNATEGLERLDGSETAIDCVVSDHDMPGPNGIEFLEAVRERDPDLPFILYTGKGSESVASEAISAGVTDYLQKGGGTEQYEILANRVADAAEKRRIEREADRTQAHLQAITDHSMDAIVTIDADSRIRFANPAVERLFGYAPAELDGEPLETLMPERMRETHREAIGRYCATGERSIDWSAAEFPGRHRDGRDIPLSISFGEFEEDGERRFVGIIRDVTERERHRAFVERSSDIVTALDENGTFQYASPSVERILGHDPADLVGEYAFGYVHPDDRERVVEVFVGSVGGDEPNPAVEYRLADADGEYLWVESVGSNRLDDHGVSGFVINTRDISERKRREEKLARLREWTRDLNYARTVAETTRLAVEAADEIIGGGLSGIHLLNEAGDALEPVALAASVPSFFDEQPSYDRGAAPGTRAALAWEAYRGDEPLAVGELSALDRLDEESPAESIVLHPIGDHGLFVISSSKPHAFTETDVLIAEILANHLEAALDRVARETSLERLHDATRSLIRADSPTEIAERVVDAAEEVLGFSVVTVRLYDEDAGGLVPVAVSDAVERVLPRREVFTPDGGSLNWAAFEGGEPRVYDDIETESAADTGTGLRSLMILPVGEHGTISVGETEPGVFDGTDEHLARILATAAETALNAAARTSRLHERSAELERQNDRLEEFASVVSHDLRNPLNVAQGRVELASDECDSEHLDAVAGAHERMDTLIADLLTLAREGERVSETRPVRLSAVVESCWQTVETADATLTVEEDLWLRADESRLRQLVENLVRNAVEHGGDDVAITVGALDGGSGTGGDGGRDGASDETSREVGFFVEDDGPGIAAEDRDEVFDAGYSTSREGTGFGLRIVEQVAAAHGWSVRIAEGGEGGARFEVTGVERADE